MTKSLIIDAETNDLKNYTKLWCVVTYCLETKELKVFDYANHGYIQDLKEYIQDATLFIGHNFIEFDREVLQHFTGLNSSVFNINKIYDTLVLSRLYNSGREGGHSLERWGAYFHIPKVKYTDWLVYDKQIIERCKKDVFITLKLYEFQKREGKNVSEFSKKQEHLFVDLLCEMRKRGFPVDAEGIQEEIMKNHAKLHDIENNIRSAFPPKPKKLAEIYPKYKKNGDMSVVGLKRLATDPLSVVGGPFSLIEWQEFNIGSSQQVVERMKEAGWKPVEFTKGGKNGENPRPKVCDANLETLPADAPEEAKMISEYLQTRTRTKLMENWIENYNPETKRIHGNIIHIGTITHRCSHNNPNTGNIPNTNGGEIRKYWGYPKDSERRIVGIDAKGLQLRILAHLTAKYTRDDTFMKAVLEGDPHIDFTLPRVAAIAPETVAYNTPEELHEVKQAKTKRFIYAYLLGAGDQKTASIFETTRPIGKAIRQGFTQAFPGLPSLREYLSECSQKGWYPLPDGSYAPIKSEHYALSVALQGIEAKLMKLAGILWRKERNKRGLDAHLITFVHDEYEIDSCFSCAEEAAQLMVACIKQAGEILKLRCPMDGDYKIGYNWLETH